jgi:hypothetical protein
MSPIVIITAVEAGFGFTLTSLVLYLVLRHGRKSYHYFFAAFLFICVIWDLGVLIAMLRNTYVDQLDIIGKIAVLPCIFIPALLFHFVNLYTGKPVRWAIITVWVTTCLTWVPILAGVFYQIEGYYAYQWGNIFKVTPSIIDPMIFVVWFGINLSSCWLLYRNVRRVTLLIQRRHYFYILASLLVVTFAIVKAFVTMGINLAFFLPLGMFLNDCFVTIIGLAIIKERLFDITVIIKKGTLFSILAAILIFVYSFIEHLLVTFVGERLGESSTVLHLIAIGVGIAVLMPVKNRIEKGVEGYFAHRKLEF